MFQDYSKICLKRSEGYKNMSSQMCHFNSRILYELKVIKTQKALKREYNDDYQGLGVRELERYCLRIQTCN